MTEVNTNSNGELSKEIQLELLKSKIEQITLGLFNDSIQKIDIDDFFRIVNSVVNYEELQGKIDGKEFEVFLGELITRYNIDLFLKHKTGMDLKFQGRVFSQDDVQKIRKNLLEIAEKIPTSSD